MTPEPKPIPREIDDATLEAAADAQASFVSSLPVRLLASRSKPEPKRQPKVNIRKTIHRYAKNKGKR